LRQAVAPRAAGPASGRGWSSARWLDVVAWVAVVLPLGFIVTDTATGRLGAEPVQVLLHRTGWWAIVLLLGTLAVSPLRRITGWNRVIRVRRTVGLGAFGYATLHVAVYLGLDQWFELAYILEDILERPFITAGAAAFLLLLPLALTSTRGAIRRLGRRWQRLHRLVYPAAILAVVHYFGMVKLDTREPLLFAGLLALLFVFRLPRLPRRRRTPEDPFEHTRASSRSDAGEPATR
jgi:methionine sulfoxide reductase heme-binding subunit